MNLILTLTNPDLLPDSLRTRQIEFSESGGTIGRNQSCDWVLEDPDRYVSSRHVSVTCKGDTFFAEDTSTNGTYLNDELIGKGTKLSLRTGDVMRVGRFNIAVEQRDGDGQLVGDDDAGSSLLDDTHSGQVLSPLAASSLAATPPGGDLLADKGARDTIDPFIDASPAPRAPSGAGDLLGDAPMSAPLAGVQDAMGDMALPAGGNVIPEDWNASGASKAAPVAPPAPEGTPEDGDFGLVPVPAPVSAPEPAPKPAPKPAPEPVAPAPAAKKPATKKAAAKKAPAKKPAPKAATKTPSKAATKAKATKPKTAKAKSAPKTAAPAPAPRPAPQPAPVAPVPTPAPVAPAPVAVAPVAAPAPAPMDAAVAGEFADGFARATGLSPASMDAQTGMILGAVLRELLDGTLNGLDARTRMQEELRLKGTMVGARENNPLKFSINSQDAIGRLLQGEATGFKAPVPAAREAMSNLTSHQLGTLGGINAGVKALLETLEPKRVATGKTVMTGPGMLNLLSANHAKVTEQTVERRDGVFWRAFTEAYKVAVAMAEER